MAKLANQNRVMAAHAHGGGTIVVLCHSACATSAHDCMGGATAALCPEGHTTTVRCLHHGGTLPLRWCHVGARPFGQRHSGPLP